MSGSTAGRLLAAQEAGTGQGDTAPGDESAKPRRNRKVSTAQRYAKRIRAEHPDAGQHHDPGRPARTGLTAGEKHVARLGRDAKPDVDPMVPPAA